MTRSNLHGLLLYPHFKITKDSFPRLMTTRKIEDDGAEYYGAFIPRIGVRSIHGFINKHFRPRSCEIEIDGNSAYPCPMFYAKQCAAPCVKSICTEDAYLERIEFTRLFLKNERDELERRVTGKIRRLAEELEFEQAAEWRDILIELQSFWSSRHKRYWKDTISDSWEIDEQGNETILFVASRRSTKILGKRAFSFTCEQNRKDRIICETLLNFYSVYVPNEIGTSFDLDNGRRLERELSRRFGRPVCLEKQAPARSAVPDDCHRTELEPIAHSVLAKKLKQTFQIPKTPRRIEAYAVAHTSATGTVASKIVWSEGKFEHHEDEVWYLGDISESEAFRRALDLRIASDPPDFFIINGGKPQIEAALKDCGQSASATRKIISPSGRADKPEDVSYFLNERLETLEVDDLDVIMLIDKILNSAEDLAIRTHNMIRNAPRFYELAQFLPEFSESERRSILKKAGSIRRLKEMSVSELLGSFDEDQANSIHESLRARAIIERKLVPVRFNDPNGEAGDLQPLGTLNY